MATLTVTQTTDFRPAPDETDIDSLVFADPDYDSVTVSLAPALFGVGKISSRLAITGGVAHDHIRLIGASSSFGQISASGWTFTGWDANDRITIIGSESGETVYGSSQSDVIRGLGGNDTLSGGAGGFDTLIGGAGNDFYDFWQGISAVVEEAGAAGGVDRIINLVLENLQTYTLPTFVENLRVYSGDGGTVIGNSLDNIFEVDEGTLTLVGGAGNDTYDLAEGDAGSTVVEEADGGIDLVIIDAGNTYQMPAYVENVTAMPIFTWDGDYIDIGASVYGNDLGNRLIALTHGGSTFFGGGGNDTIDGGYGPDSFFGGSGDDSLSGGGRSDTLSGGEGNDTLVGGEYGDTYLDVDASDLIIEAADAFGIDTIKVSVSFLLANAPNIEGLILAGSADLRGEGTDSKNSITGNSGANLLKGWGESDTLFGGSGNDTLRGGDAGDKLSGDAGFDTLFGDAGNDLLNGDDQADTLNGGDGNDSLNGGDGNDGLYGADGDDSLDGGRSRDALDGGAGNDTLNGGEEADIVNGKSGHDSMLGGSGDDAVFGEQGNDTLNGNDGTDVLTGGDGNDSLDGGAGNDSLMGGAGNDTLVSYSGDDTMIGGVGDDVYYVGVGKSFLIEEVAGAGNDTIVLVNRSYTLKGEIENAVIDGQAYASLAGNAVGNRLTGNIGANTLNGMGGDDTLDGGGSSDTVLGGGADILIGGAGNDLLIARADDDIFRFGTSGQGIDRIANFSTSEDRFDLAAGQHFTAFTEANGSTNLTYGGGKILIEGITGRTLQQWNDLVLPEGGARTAAPFTADSPDAASAFHLADLSAMPVLPSFLPAFTHAEFI